MTPHQCWCVCGLKKSTSTADEEEKPLLPAMANSHPKGGPASFRHPDLFTQNTKARLKRRESFIPKEAQSVHTTTQFEKEGYQQARSIFKDLSHFPPRFSFLSPHPSSCDQACHCRVCESVQPSVHQRCETTQRLLCCGV